MEEKVTNRKPSYIVRRKMRDFTRVGYSYEEALKMSKTCLRMKNSFRVRKSKKRNAQVFLKQNTAAPGNLNLPSELQPISSHQSSNCKQSDVQNPINGELDRVPPSSQDTKRVVTLLIFPVGYPNERLNKEQFNSLYNIILNKVLECSNKLKGPAPAFFSFKWKSGCDLAQVVCRPSDAAWLKDCIPKLSSLSGPNPWSGPKLTTIDVENSSKYKILTVTLPDCASFPNNAILDLLQKQNARRLDVDLWRLMKRNDSPGCTVLKFCITDGMTFALNEFGNHLFFGLGQASFKIDDFKDSEPLPDGEVAGWLT